MKKTILHIIDNLSRGGAETMLVAVTKNLPDYHNIIVTLNEVNEFEEGEVKCDELICLKLKSPKFVPLAAIKLRAIIKEKKVDLVHSHLFWSTVIARFGVPKKIPLITTIHAFVATSIEYSPWHMKAIEKLTYKIRKSYIVADAKGALDEYFSFIDVKPHNASPLYSFVNTEFLKECAAKAKKENKTFRLVSVGNLKTQKNHRFLLEAFKELKDEDITLDIYGKGILQEELQQTIDEHHLKVTLKGQAVNINEQLQQYDLFIMSSSYEGLAVSVLEAMAIGMPILLTDIMSFKEQCDDTADYYELDNKHDFISKLFSLKNNRQRLQALSTACKKRVQENYTLQKHLESLTAIYHKELAR